MNKQKISQISEDILDGFRDWYGPDGLVWCEKHKTYVIPDSCSEGCPECTALKSQNVREFRYLHLHDDFKSY